MNLSKIILATILSLTLTGSLWAGVLMTLVDQRADQTADQTTMKMYLEKDRLRVENSGKDENQVIIYRQDKDLFWVLDLKKKTYMEITKADLDRMQGQMDEASKQMEEAMKDMPPEQREMMAKMMKGKMPAAPAKTTYKKVSSGQKINQWTCTQYEGESEGKKASEVWTTDWKSLGLTAEDFNVLEALSKFWEGMAKSSSQLFKVEAGEPAEGHYSGVPVKTAYYSGGKVSHTNEMQSLERQDFEASKFDLPASFAKEEMPQERKHK
jgi:hypothetical protein